MKPYSRTNGSVRVRNRSKLNSVPRKNRRTGFKVANPSGPWDTFATGGHVLRARLRKAKGLSKANKTEYYIDKI